MWLGLVRFVINPERTSSLFLSSGERYSSIWVMGWMKNRLFLTSRLLTCYAFLSEASILLTQERSRLVLPTAALVLLIRGFIVELIMSAHLLHGVNCNTRDSRYRLLRRKPLTYHTSDASSFLISRDLHSSDSSPNQANPNHSISLSP